MLPQNIGVVITTYNAPHWLAHVLTGYECQTFGAFRTIIADDGSTDETRAVIDAYRNRGRLSLDHVWHPDEGFRKCAILNRAIRSTDCDYLIFTDGDCIPHPDFVGVHAAHAAPGVFLSGGYIKLTMAVSETIHEDDIRSGVIFERAWLIARGQPRSPKLLKLVRSPALKNVLNRVTPTAATWNGMNSSTWTKDIVAVNGFNEDMQYGGLDREFGERLRNYGQRPKQIRYSAVCLHLDHARGYAKPEIRAKNDAIRRQVKATGATWAQNGIDKPPLL